MSFKTIIILCFTVLWVGSARTQTIETKSEVVNSIAEKISQVYGTELKKPQIELVPGKRNLIMYYPGTEAKIVMDEHLYDLCISFESDSSNALAALIGHELAHHYENHNWCYSFITVVGQQLQKTFRIKRNSKEQKLKLETEANYFGSISANIAGFDSHFILPKLFDKIYEEYNISQINREYPSKKELKQIVIDQQNEQTDLASVMKTGKYLYALKEYEPASQCFDNISSVFPSSLLLNKQGICKLHEALNNQSLEEMPFILPVEIDPYGRLSAASSSEENIPDKEKKITKEQFISEARDYLDSSLIRNPENINTKVNRSISLLLANQDYEAKAIINDIKEDKADELTSEEFSNIYTLKGIIQYKNEDTVKAIRYFEKALELDNNLTTEFNLSAINEIGNNGFDGYSDFVINFFDESGMRKKEQMLNPSAEKLASKNPVDYQMSESHLSLKLKNKSGGTISADHKPHYSFINYKDDQRGFNFLETSNNSPSKTREDIGLKSHLSEVKDKYGEPTYEIDIINETYLIYSKARLIFMINDQNEVAKWALYRSELN